jgi:uncharacterized membrane protein
MDLKTMELVYQLMIGIIIPLVATSLKQAHWPSVQKFALVFGLSLVAAALIPLANLASGKSFDSELLFQSLTVIFTTSQVIYRAAVKPLALETAINPQSALLSLVKDQVSMFLQDMDKATAFDLLDPNGTQTVKVSISQETIAKPE